MKNNYKGVEFYSYDLIDAISLAKIALHSQDLKHLSKTIPFFCADISRYNPNHEILKKLKSVNKKVKEFLKEMRKIK